MHTRKKLPGWQTGAFSFGLCLYVTFKSLTYERCVFTQNNQELTFFQAQYMRNCRNVACFRILLVHWRHFQRFTMQLYLHNATWTNLLIFGCDIWHGKALQHQQLWRKKQFEKWSLKAAKNSEVFNWSRRSGVLQYIKNDLILKTNWN